MQSFVNRHSQQTPALEDVAQADESASISEREPWETLAALELKDGTLPDQRDDARQWSAGMLSQSEAGATFSAGGLPTEVTRTKRMRAIRMTSSFSYSEAKFISAM